jgi:ADP-heptose:LPS heptosyltransferase
MNSWYASKRVLCIRPDNMGDLLMSGPAIRALKFTFNCHITVLTSSLGAPVTCSMPEIDDTIIFDAPWVQSEKSTAAFDDIIAHLKKCRFDAAVIFTVYSQNPLPSVMLAYLAGIPLRLAYCRENPYRLLTHWVPEQEPYDFIRHQVRRDLDLVTHAGAYTDNENLGISVQEDLWPGVRRKLENAGADFNKPLIVLHPEVSEVKRRYPVEKWISAGKILSAGYQLIITGKNPENEIASATGAVSLCEQLSLEELIVLIKHVSLLIAVNTGPVHIAAATATPVVVLYAMTNPQHTPWNVKSRVLYFEVPEHLCSKNEVIKYVRKSWKEAPSATPENIITAATELLGCFQQPHALS